MVDTVWQVACDQSTSTTSLDSVHDARHVCGWWNRTHGRISDSIGVVIVHALRHSQRLAFCPPVGCGKLSLAVWSVIIGLDSLESAVVYERFLKAGACSSPIGSSDESISIRIFIMPTHPASNSVSFSSAMVDLPRKPIQRILLRLSIKLNFAHLEQ